MLIGLHQFITDRPILAALLSLLAGASMPLSVAPFDFWYLPVLAVFALLFCLNGDKPRLSLLNLYLFSVAMSGVGVSWIYVSIHEHGQAPVSLASLLVVLFVLAVSIFILVPGWFYLKYLSKTALGICTGFSALWLFKEWLSTWLFTGFPWLMSGYSQLETPLQGYGPVLGVLGIGFVLTLTSSLMFVLVTIKQRPGQRILVGGLIVSIWLGGFVLDKLQWVSPVAGPVRVSLVQGNIDQRTKWRREMVWPIVSTYIDLSKDEWGRDLIVWPEASITLFRSQAETLLDELDLRGKRFGTSLVLGLPDRDDDGGFLNTAVVVGEGQGRYVKRHLVPFGEYLPMESVLRGLIKVFDLPMSHNKPGPDGQVMLKAGDLNVAISICYEVIFPDLVRRNQGNPDVLITISNDTWFGASIGPLQHAQMAQMRALENGRYMLRATNNGLTAVIDPKGRVMATLPQFEQGVLRAEVYKMVGITPYANWGHKGLLWLVLILTAGVLVWQRLGTR